MSFLDTTSFIYFAYSIILFPDLSDNKDFIFSLVFSDNIISSCKFISIFIISVDIFLKCSSFINCAINLSKQSFNIPVSSTI